MGGCRLKHIVRGGDECSIPEVRVFIVVMFFGFFWGGRKGVRGRGRKKVRDFV